MLNFAILSAGHIAEKMAKTITQTSCHVTPYAIAARDGARAQAMATQYGFSKSYASYEALFSDDAVDIVYIGTTHNFHAQHVRAALEAGKHVLCEKPFTVNAHDARALFALARSKNLILAEAMWTRAQPFTALLQENLPLIGAPRHLCVEMGMPLADKPRIALPELAGGVLLDLGIYTLTIADILLGTPSAPPAGICHKNENGMDIHDSILLQYEGGTSAALSFSGECQMNNKAILYGTQGRLEIETPFWAPQSFTVYTRDTKVVHAPFDATGYEYEVRALADAIAQNLPECPQLPHNATLRILDQMDALRKNWGIAYPFECIKENRCHY